MSSLPNYAPIAVFTYNRPEHTARLLRSLQRNTEFSKSPLTIYCDAPKRPEHEEGVKKNREVVRRLAPAHARIVERDQNFGLARSIITGVSELVAEHGTAIIVEDDLVFSPRALAFLNEGLRRYADNDRVMHVSAYMFPVDHVFREPFFYREATCWGWATWGRAWAHFNPDAAALLDEIDRLKARPEFDVRSSMFFYHMLKLQRDGKLDSWAIRWYASMFLHGGLALHPARSYVENSGFDGSGVHCNIDADRRFDVATTSALPKVWPDFIVESEEAISAMVNYRLGWGNKRARFKRLFWYYLRKLPVFN